MFGILFLLSLTSMKLLTHLTLRIYDTVPSLFDHPCFQSFWPTNMRSRYFRNGVTWSYTGYEAHLILFFLYSCIAGHMKLLGHQKLDKMTFHQFELSICASYMFTACMDPSSAAKQSNLNPLKRKKIQISKKIQTYFFNQ